MVLGGPGLGVCSLADFESLVAALGDAKWIIVDIPIGLSERSARQADAEARKVLGPRASSVFLTPPRIAIEQDNYALARQEARQLTGRSLSSQGFALRQKILEVAAVAERDPRVLEGHPEVSFWALAGGRPMSHSKKTWNGQMERRQLLAEAGLALPDRLKGTAGHVPVDDILDAAVLAWTARRVVEGTAGSLPDPPELIGGRRVAIWY